MQRQEQGKRKRERGRKTEPNVYGEVRKKKKTERRKKKKGGKLRIPKSAIS
jgi:hypothetical protein